MKSPVMRMRETCFSICDDLDLTRTERLEVAAFVLHQEVGSFNDLGPVELVRVLDALRGAKYVASIR